MNLQRSFYQIIILILILMVWTQPSLSSPFCEDLLSPQPNLDSVLDRINPFELYQSWFLGVSYERLAPRSFFEDDKKGPIVGINGVKPGQVYQRAADYMSGVTYSNEPHVFHAQVNSPEDMVDYFLEVYSQVGPIHKAVIAAHGLPGSLLIGRSRLSKKWVESHQAWLSQLPRDLFAKDAQVVLVSCFCGQGIGFNPGYGTESLETIFSPLLKQGGSVVASNRYVDPEYRLIPKKYKTKSERVVRHLFLAPVGALSGTINWIVSDWTSKIQKVRQIQIPSQTQ